MDTYPTAAEAAEQVVETGRRMYEHGYVVTNDGNVSVRLSEDTVLMTPTGVCKGRMTPEMMLVMRLDGTVVSGTMRPSSESAMHLRVYRESPETRAVVHAHPVCATAFACAGRALDVPLLMEAVVNLGTVPVARYATTGTEEVPDSIAPFCRDYDAVLLANHGALTWGISLEEAYRRLEVLENAAQISVACDLIGGPRVLSQGQVDDLARVRAKTGAAPVRMPLGSKQVTNDRDVLPKEG